MANIAILDDESEVVALIFQFLTHGHHAFFKAIGTSDYVLDSLVAFRPAVIVLPLYRTAEAIARPVRDYRLDIRGAALLESVSRRPELERVPIIVVGLSTLECEMPAEFRARVRVSDFLAFPEGLQLLNPTISGYVGPAEGTDEDLDRLRASLEAFRRADP